MRWMTTWIACCMVVCALETYAQEWERLNIVSPSSSLRGISVTERFVYAVGAYGTIVKSEDFGETWLPLHYNNRNWRRVRFAHDNVGWICGDDGYAARTNDAGATWSEHFLFSGDVRDIWSSDGIRAVAVGDRGIISITNDSGQTWVDVQTGTDIYDDLLGVDFANELHGCAVGGYSATRMPRILITQDGGLNWDAVTTPYHGWLSSVKYIDTETLVAVGKYGTVLRSEDGGLSWDSVYALRWEDVALRDVDFSDSLHGSAIADDGTTIATSDGGITWFQQDISSYSLQGLDLLPGGAGIAVGGFGVSFTGNFGATWTNPEPIPGGDVLAVEFIENLSGWLLVQNNFIYSTSNGGESWQVNRIPVSESAAKLCAVSDSVAVVASDIAGIFRTSDGGASWSNVSQFNNISISDLSFANEDTGFACGNVGVILASFDGGLTWQMQDSGGPALTSIHAVDGQHVWAVGASGVVKFYSGSDGWRVHTEFPLSIDFAGVHFTDSMHGVIIGSDGAITYTEDGGENWRWAAPQLNTLTAVEFADRNIGWICGTNWHLTRTDDGGRNWTAFNEHYSPNFFDIAVTSSRVWVVGLNGTVLRGEYVSGIENERHALPASYSLSAYPNPFNSSATLHFELPREAKVEIVLYDVLGREALRLAENVYTAGTHRALIDATPLASGVYFAELRTPEYSSTLKLLLLR
ncbi:T9SS type A sorting domain-containing protein [bacterium]|nr:T9SS type A sorting domain-containing protein [bacterium]